MKDENPKTTRSKFPRLYWLVVMFEFFERGSYYGMMSVLSVYLTDVLHFPKENVGLIKGTIQPLLYFLPIISGALADRFGYRRTLLVAFGLLGSGYFLVSQATSYSLVFLSLVVMGIGAGTFKPIISGTIARCTDESNSTLGFGIFYWSINLGAFVFPLFLVPYLKNNIGWDWVILASAIGTGAMLVPTLLFYKEPPAPPQKKDTKKPKLLQTLANAFEIIYSPFILLFDLMRRTTIGVVLVIVIASALLGYGAWDFWRPSEASLASSARRFSLGDSTLQVEIERNLTKAEPFQLKPPKDNQPARLVIHDPDKLSSFSPRILEKLKQDSPNVPVSHDDLARFVREAGAGFALDVVVDRGAPPGHRLERRADDRYLLTLGGGDRSESEIAALANVLRVEPDLAALSDTKLKEVVQRGSAPPFILLFVGMLFVGTLLLLRLAPRFKAAPRGKRMTMVFGTLAVSQAILWGLHLAANLSLFATILSAAISTTLLSLLAIETDELARFKDHFRFLFMIFIYSGFWVLYFQMFDSVLWYVQAYVDASSLNSSVNGVLAAVGLNANWRFDVEHVTVINAGTIILLQLLISTLVKKTKALPTMVVGITLGTIGMAILAISTGIWVFMLGIVIFSVGEMTAHPKFISYVGQTAPKARVAMYMGYLFLYGVIGSSIGGVVGANLYVKFVDEMNQPRTLWLIFAGIGVATIIGLLLYNRFLVPKEEAK